MSHFRNSRVDSDRGIGRDPTPQGRYKLGQIAHPASSDRFRYDTCDSAPAPPGGPCQENPGLPPPAAAAAAAAAAAVAVTLVTGGVLLWRRRRGSVARPPPPARGPGALDVDGKALLGDVEPA